MLGRSRISFIKGTRKLFHRNQLLISLGLPALDVMIGGGFPVGGIFLVEDDEFGDFTKFVLRYYLAEGVMNDHQLLLASLDVESKEVIRDLPDPLIIPTEKIPANVLVRLGYCRDKPLRKPNDESEHSFRNYTSDVAAFGNTYGLSTHRGMMYWLTMKTKVDHWKVPEDSTNVNTYENLYGYIKTTLENKKYCLNSPSPDRTVLRIAIISIGTGYWIGNIQRFLIKLRLLVRNFCATCFISIQPRFFDKKDMSRIEHLCDAVIQLEAFYKGQDETNGDSYDGLVILKKSPSVNCWTPLVKTPSDEWVFKVKKGSRFILEKLNESTSPRPVKRIRRDNDDGRT